MVSLIKKKPLTPTALTKPATRPATKPTDRLTMLRNQLDGKAPAPTTAPKTSMPAVTAQPAPRPASTVRTPTPAVTATPAPAPRPTIPRVTAQPAPTSGGGLVNSGQGSSSSGMGITVEGPGNRGSTGGGGTSVLDLIYGTRKGGGAATSPAADQFGRGGVRDQTVTTPGGGTTSGALPGDANADGGIGGGFRGTTQEEVVNQLTGGEGIAPEDPRALEGLEEDFIRSLLEGVNDVNTDEEEALIREEMDRLMGQGLVDARARGGAAGFAQSGAQLAAEGGIRRDAARDVSGRILDTRSKAKQQAIDNAFGGIGADVDLMTAAQDAELFDMMMNLLADGEISPPGPDSPGPTAPQASPPLGIDQVEEAATNAAEGAVDLFPSKGTDQTEVARSQDGPVGDLSLGDMANSAKDWMLPTPPPGGQRVGRSYASNGKQYDLFRMPDGSVVRMPVGR